MNTVDGALQSSENLPTRERISILGNDLQQYLQAVLDAFPQGGGGPQALATAVGTNKVFTSRLLKALRQKDPISVLNELPGPEPLGRFLASLAARDVPQEALTPARAAVAAFERVIREEAGDRSSLNAVLSAWLPDSQEFEARRRQAAFKALSQLKGASAEVNLATVILAPSADGEHLDLVWVMGMLGLRRLRPGATVKLASRRLTGGETEDRHPEVFGRLDLFCSAPPAPVEQRSIGETTHYLLGGEAFGLRSAVDLLIAESNLGEMKRWQPEGSGRRSYVFAECGTPAELLVFDCLVHKDVFRGDPELAVFDTVLEGVADPNDEARQVDRLQTNDRVELLGTGLERASIAEMPSYVDMVTAVVGGMGWNPGDFRGYRTRSEYPLHGAQFAYAFDAGR